MEASAGRLEASVDDLHKQVRRENHISAAVEALLSRRTQ